MLKTILKFSLLASTINYAWADDAIEASATGNIVFEKTSELIMQDETLTITKSAGKQLGDDKVDVDVDFHFKNISNHAITRKIAFVLPPVLCREDMHSSWKGPNSTDADQNNILSNFKTSVDNKPQSYTTRIEATLDKKNITALLKKLNIPLNPCAISFNSDGKADIKYRDALEKNNLLVEPSAAAWAEHIYFEWTQTFPAEKVINIHHHYTTTTGGSVLASRTSDDLNQIYTERTPKSEPLWNHSLNTLNKSLIKTDGNQQRFCVMPIWVQYHLVTGAQWNGGIGNFKLIIKDESNTPFAINKFYNNTQTVHTTINGRTMTFGIDNFVPTENLFIQFLSLPKNKKDLQYC